MRAEIVSIGTELLLGTITDTNASFIAQRLAALGIDCFYVSHVGDNLDRLVEVIGRAWERSDLTVTTGGLGPTQDDLTREAIARLLGEMPSVDPTLMARLDEFYRQRRTQMPARNVKQATLIPSARAIDNPVGTAPGWWVEREEGGTVRRIVSMPGVPFEMTRMWEREVEPKLRPLTGSVLVSRTLKVLGLGESRVDELLEDLMSGSNPTLAPYAKRDGVHLRISAKAADEQTARAMIAGLEKEARGRLGDAIYGSDDDTPQSVVLGLLQERGATLGVLEVGEGATGAVSSTLGAHSLVRGTLQAGSIEGLRHVLASADGEYDLDGLTAEFGRDLGADYVLAVAADLTPLAGDPSSATAAGQIILWRAASGEEGAARHVQQGWTTARTEVPRLLGLAAINLLRRELLAPDWKGGS